MAEEIFSGYDAQSLPGDTKCQKLLECILTGNSKLYLGKVYTEDHLSKLSEEEVEKLFNPSGTKGGSKTTPPRFFLCSIS